MVLNCHLQTHVDYAKGAFAYFSAPIPVFPIFVLRLMQLALFFERCDVGRGLATGTGKDFHSASVNVVLFCQSLPLTPDS